MVNDLAQASAGSVNKEHIVSDSIRFFELWNLDVILFSVVVIVLYLLLVGKWRKRIEGATPVAPLRQVCFILGMILLILVKGTPLDYYGNNYLLSFHMLQMAVLVILIPPLILLGLKDWMFAPIMKTAWSRKALFVITHPLVSLILFNLLFSLYHIPYIFDNLMTIHFLHSLYFIVLWIGAALMWWPLMDIFNEKKITGLYKIGYMVGNSILITPVCALIIFARNPLYVTYMDTPQIFSFLPLLHDQQLGGVIMKVFQEIIYMVAVAIIFFQWAKEERKKEKQVDEEVWQRHTEAFNKSDASHEEEGKRGFNVSGATPTTDGLK